MKDMLSIKNTEMCWWGSREGNITRVWMKNSEKNRKIPFINGIYDFNLLDLDQPGWSCSGLHKRNVWEQKIVKLKIQSIFKEVDGDECRRNN